MPFPDILPNRNYLVQSPLWSSVRGVQQLQGQIASGGKIPLSGNDFAQLYWARIRLASRHQQLRRFKILRVGNNLNYNQTFTEGLRIFRDCTPDCRCSYKLEKGRSTTRELAAVDNGRVALEGPDN